ncbi:MAG TPA: hypothetical protein VGY77_08945 [Gemmataceae bacterium]|nr:hypothetical protein [Gemmataceae bacterium]
MKFAPRFDSFRPKCEILENRSLPGSVFGLGADLSVLAGTIQLDSLLSPLGDRTPSAPLIRAASSPAPSAPSGISLNDFGTQSPVRQDPLPVGQSIFSAGLAGPDLQLAAGHVRPSQFHSAGGGSDTLWYNGDFDGRNALANEHDTLVPDARVYDDFNVTDDPGWDLTHLWSNNVMTFFPDAATYEIRSGVSVGSGGTLIASGAGAPTIAFHPISGSSLMDITVDIALDTPIHLDPGTYFLNVTPSASGPTSFERSFNSTTSGANSVGTPGGNNGNSFFDSTSFSFSFAATSTLLGSGTWDFSMGVGGSVSGG